MLHGLISAAELNYDGASVSLPPPTLRSNYRLFNFKCNVQRQFFSPEALQMRNCTTRQLSYRSRFVKYCFTKYKVQRKYYKNILIFQSIRQISRNLLNIPKIWPNILKCIVGLLPLSASVDDSQPLYPTRPPHIFYQYLGCDLVQYKKDATSILNLKFMKISSPSISHLQLSKVWMVWH